MEDMLDVLLEQERLLQHAAFGAQEAWKLGSWIVHKALEEQLPIAVDIAVANRCLFHWSADGATVDNACWSERKKRSVLRFGHSSFFLGRRLAALGVSAAEKHYVDETEFAFHGGCFPIILRGTGMVGTLTISGLRQEDDHDLAVEALAELLGISRTVPRIR